MSSPPRAMERVRAYSRKSGRATEEGLPPLEWAMVNTTSRARASDFGRAFSPMLVGPVPLPDGMTSRMHVAAYQFSRVYAEQAVTFCPYHKKHFGTECRAHSCKKFTTSLKPTDHIGADGLPTENWWRWARAGWAYEVDPDDPASREYLRRPMGSGVTPVYSYWDGRKLSPIEARKEIYVRLYAEAITQTPAWEILKARYDAGECLKLYDVDGRNLYNTGESYKEALNDLSRPFGHSMVLCALLEGVALPALTRPSNTKSLSQKPAYRPPNSR